ncbi:uncharacterized protein [Fopius arisanus]|uniref:Uncharacterized protein isoform X2 n=1 Tax=Fopius arisanus TaxID=64838 RepID=A0A9R1TT51_9HYME|nr:PREDICTED: uncharacterized protein LOC105273904 isoform X2 [Fopius arisanus]
MVDNWRSWCCWTTSYWMIYICILLVCRIKESTQQIVIEELKVPKVVKAGDNTSVILDCVYDLHNSSTRGLVVKWYVNDTILLYQWIYGLPPITDPTDEHIQCGYKATDDPTTMYRAMKINNLNIKHTGDYKCNVFSVADDVSRETSMIVYSPEETFDLKYEKNDDESGEVVEVTCIAGGLYPEPTLEISVNDIVFNRTEDFDAVRQDDGKYNITAVLIAENAHLQGETVIKCTLRIPNANYTNWRFLTYSSGTATSTPSVTTNLLRKMDIQVINNTEPNTDNGGGWIIDNTSLVSTIY